MVDYTDRFGKNCWVWQGGLQPTTTFKNENRDESFNNWADAEVRHRNDDYYFNSYENHNIHEDMLKDHVRTGAYYHAIVKQPQLFKDKIVLDVGAGTGILSLFAARAGARKVIAIEFSNIVQKAKQIIETNGYEDTITMIQMKAEDADSAIEALGEELGFAKGEKFVDIIISEWMGYFLLYESMLDSVLRLRDTFLAPNGQMYPDKATLNIAVLEDAEYKAKALDFWDNVYSFNLSPMKSLIYEECIVDYVNYKNICSDAACILELDLLTCKIEDLEFVSDFKLNIQSDDYGHGLVTWFDIGFMANHRPVVFSTSPYGTGTHWKQTTFYFKEDLTVYKNDTITGTIAVRKNKRNFRDLDIKVKFIHESPKNEENVNKTQYFRIG